MVRSNPKFGTGHNFLFWGKDHGICSILQVLHVTPVPTGDVGGATPPMDLASQIQAKLAARKPMTSSPTQKDFPAAAGEDPFRRSNTLSSQSSMGEIR